MTDALPAAGYLIVKTYASLLREHTPVLERGIYGIPAIRDSPARRQYIYRGIDREPLSAWPERMLALSQGDLRSVKKPPPHEWKAVLRAYEIETEGRSDDDFFFELDDACDVFARIEPPVEREIIWAADASADVAVPPGVQVLGYEPTWFWGDHFSPVCDAMFLARWHGADLKGVRFREMFDSLNKDGLFETAEEASEFLRVYRAWEGAETGDYVIACIGAVDR